MLNILPTNLHFGPKKNTMKIKLLKLFPLILVLVSFYSSTFGQPQLSSNPETIINGRIWVPSHSIAQADQFLFGKLELNGSIKFKGQQFNNLKFFYDISKELIITSIETENNTKRNIVINPSYLEEFNVKHKNLFYQFKRGDLIHEELNSTHFYQVFSNFSITYIVKYLKVRNLNSKIGSSTFNYFNNNQLYVVHKGVLSSINNKNDIIKLFPLQKKETKKFIRAKKLKINKNTPLDAIPFLIKFDQ